MRNFLESAINPEHRASVSDIEVKPKILKKDIMVMTDKELIRHCLKYPYPSQVEMDRETKELILLRLNRIQGNKYLKTGNKEIFTNMLENI
jgi:hypothetical protein